MFYLTPGISILLIWVMVFSSNQTQYVHGLLKLVLLSFVLSIGVSYFLVLAAFRFIAVARQEKSDG